MKFSILFRSTYIVYILFDLIWLRVLANNYYTESIGNILRKQLGEVASNVPAALLVYTLLTLGILFFVISVSHNYKEVFIRGSLFGLIIYGFFDFSNYALLANWPLKITLIDLSWGVFLCTMTSCFAFFVHTLCDW